MSKHTDTEWQCVLCGVRWWDVESQVHLGCSSRFSKTLNPEVPESHRPTLWRDVAQLLEHESRLYFRCSG